MWLCCNFTSTYCLLCSTNMSTKKCFLGDGRIRFQHLMLNMFSPVQKTVLQFICIVTYNVIVTNNLYTRWQVLSVVSEI